MNKNNLLADELPDQASLMANWEDRISLLEHNVAVLQGRMPKNKVRRAFWFLYNGFLTVTPIIGGATAIFVEDPWKTPVILIVFLLMTNKSIRDFLGRIDQGPRPHRSIIMKDHR